MKERKKMSLKSTHALRQEYRMSSLNMSDTDANPFTQFGKWFADAVQAGVEEPNAMFLATVGKEGIPSGRIVLLKDFSEDAFVFFTNYSSRKGQELQENPFAAVTFFWKEIQRQVRIQGTTEKVTGEESDDYFLSRPEESRIGAIISPQSRVIPDRTFLEDQYKTFDRSKSTNRPAHWGGYRLVPFLFEFWQGREFRLHDRICYRLSEGAWVRERLAP